MKDNAEQATANIREMFLRAELTRWKKRHASAVLYGNIVTLLWLLALITSIVLAIRGR